MYQRKVLDIELHDLARGLRLCSTPSLPRARMLREIEQMWSDGRAVLTSLSVRTGFDLLLGSIDFGDRREILLTSVTIPHMEQIIRHHGLIPVPVEFDPEDMQTSARAIERAIGPNTGAMLITHLFGTRAPLDDFVALAREHDLLLIEDCAQAFDGLGYAGDRDADVSMFSFGTIKSATALGGALFSIRDHRLAARMRATQAGYPMQPRRTYTSKLLKYLGLASISSPRRYGVLVGAMQAAGLDYDMVIRGLTRGFNGPGFWDRIRHQMCDPHVAMLHHRLCTYDPQRLDERARSGKLFASMLDDQVVHFGWRCARHTHWLFPVVVANPLELIEVLRAEGFDATSGSSALVAVDADEEYAGPGLDHSRTLMSNIVYLPVGVEVPVAALERMAAAVNEHARPLAVPTLQLLDQEDHVLGQARPKSAI